MLRVLSLALQWHTISPPTGLYIISKVYFRKLLILLASEKNWSRFHYLWGVIWSLFKLLIFDRIGVSGCDVVFFYIWILSISLVLMFNGISCLSNESWLEPLLDYTPKSLISCMISEAKAAFVFSTPLSWRRCYLARCSLSLLTIVLNEPAGGCLTCSMSSGTMLFL